MPVEEQTEKVSPIEVGATQLGEYLPLLADKRVAVLANHSSLVGTTHLVDTLLAREVDIVKVFAPEHGFRGDRPDGETIDSSKDIKTGLPIVSMYGKNKTLPVSLIDDVDVVIFDIQDVGVRFYTYISAMHYAMESCAKAGKKMVVLDRPNPNGMYVDGPLLDTAFRSYVGMHPIPVVHGLTVGELAEMINGEGWLASGSCDLTVVKTRNYNHSMGYNLPVKPSPNLPNDLAIALYPSLALFEGTEISVGRGTYKPFLQIGHPSFELPHTFTPQSIENMSKYPPLEGEECHGYNLENSDFTPQFTLKWLLDFYQRFDNKEAFFKPYFNTLAGSDQLKSQIQQGMNEEAIRASWQPGLDEYRQLRKKYLLYPDFD